MKRIVLATSMLLAASFIASTAGAQPCCWGYRVRYYRVQPYYQYLYYAPPPPPRWSLGVHATGITTNQMFDKDAVILGGAGGHLRLRGYRWAGELAVDVMGGSYLEGHISRVSVPLQLSAMLYLIPEGRFNLFLLGGMRVQPTTMKLDYPSFQRRQTFAEFGLHGGVGAEIVLSHGFALTTDLRFFGMLRDDSSAPGKFYEGVHDGVLPRDTIGLQLNAGISFRF
jgi:hypothetical protein